MVAVSRRLIEQETCTSRGDRAPSKPLHAKRQARPAPSQTAVCSPPDPVGSHWATVPLQSIFLRCHVPLTPAAVRLAFLSPLNLVYNPLGPSLPPDQGQTYKEQLVSRHGIVFNQLFTITNMPINSFGSQLLSRPEFHDYMTLLKGASRPEYMGSVMCKTLIFVNWQGEVFDCDFNQMLGLPLGAQASRPIRLTELLDLELSGQPIRIADHCYGCTAGQRSRCGGAFVDALPGVAH